MIPNHCNVIITDIPGIPDKSIQEYKLFLESLIPEVVAEYIANHPVQLNILTDRIMLNEMNNCNSGDESLTLAPDGNFYLCPAFFNEGGNSVGDIDTGIKIKNPQLLKLSNAPICRNCDAYQCKRCIWLNQKLTREVNTPGREQCVVAHIERNASKKLLEELRKINAKYQAEIHIPEIDHLDPFELLKN